MDNFPTMHCIKRFIDCEIPGLSLFCCDYKVAILVRQSSMQSSLAMKIDSGQVEWINYSSRVLQMWNTRALYREMLPSLFLHYSAWSRCYRE